MVFDFDLLVAVETGAPALPDLALGCPAEASSAKSREKRASFAVDGDAATRWTSAYADNQWLAVDLGRDYALSQVAVRWEAAFARTYLLQGSANGGMDWTTLASERGREGWVVTLLRAESRARWVRVFGQRRATEYGFSIWEVRVYERRALPSPSEASAASLRPFDAKGGAAAGAATDGAPAIVLRVRGSLTGEVLCELRVGLGASVGLVKEAIAQRTGIPPEEQRLLAQGRQLCSCEAARDALPRNGSGSREDARDALPTGGGGEAAGDALHGSGGLADISLVRLARAYASRCARLADDVRSNRVRFKDLEEELRGDLELALAALDVDRMALRHATPEVQGHRPLVLHAVRWSGLALCHASESLRRDRDLVLAAIRSSAAALRFASEELRSDRQLVLEAVGESGEALEFASEELRGDREVALSAVRSVRHGGAALAHVAEALRADRELVMEAVQRQGSALRFADEALKADVKIVSAAVASSRGAAIEHAAEAVRGDLRRGAVGAAVSLDGRSLRHATRELRRNKDFVLRAVRAHGLALEFAAEELRADRDVVAAAVHTHGSALEFAAEELRADGEVALAAVRQDPSAVSFVSMDLLADPTFTEAAAALGAFTEDGGLEALLLVRPEVARDLSQRDLAVLLDVRSLPEFDQAHIPGAHWVYQCRRMEQSLLELAEQRTVIVYSNAGQERSRCVPTAQALRRQVGVHRVLRLRGGLERWREDGLPLESGFAVGV